ncbi:proto-oncogene tyrosine-protein kinase receptor Ret [Parasteatoda tepidariorum]|uniref:proto-oncogene tyrosine-protein kinase receptor Ret n=1 Tax=Parasteatoda tepidariorum TaxID=114398 RepID=UPI0039BCA7B5
MTCGRVSRLSRQRSLMTFVALASFMAQGLVYGWDFPTRQAKISIPLDFPLHVPFYRVLVVPDITELAESPSVELSISKIRTHVGNATDFRNVRVKPLVEIGLNNGSLWLVRKPADLKLFEDPPQGKEKYHITVNITVSGETKSTGVTKKAEVLLTLSGIMKTFCQPSERSCFMNSNSKYNLPEEIQVKTVFDHLQNPSYFKFCPSSTVVYSVVEGESFIQIKKQTGELSTTSLLKTVSSESFSFKVSCAVDDATFDMNGRIKTIDTNNNPPLLQDGNSSKTEIRYLKPGEKWVSFSVNVIDKDSKAVNDLVVRIENDSLNLFRVKNIKIYEILNTGHSTFFYAEIVPQRALSFPGDYYNFTVFIEDKSYIHGNSMVEFSFSVINQTQTELPFEEVYQINISRNAGQYSRLIQLTKYNYSRRFRFSIGTHHLDWLGITEQTGIVYVRDRLLMPTETDTRRVIWTTKNETSERSGSILLDITILEDNSTNTCSEEFWCSYYSEQSDCIDACGMGSNSGHCLWRPGSLTNTGPRPNYSTCSPEFSFCPDGVCDELEQIEPKLCPQDCASQVTGEATMHSNGRGIFLAVGTCSCQTTDRCKCIRVYPPPSEMRRPKMFRKSNILSLPKDINATDDENVYVEVRGVTSNSNDAIPPLAGPFIDGTCGAACILIATMVPFGLIMFIVIFILARKLKAKSLVRHKFVGGSHISLSAVPSDYVEEGSNSIQESRNTPSETASFGKTAIETKWEFPKNKLQFTCLLGEGEFGKVMRAEAWNIAGNKGYTTVAVKMLKENGGVAERQDLFTEFLLLKEISHPNIVRLLGATVEKNGEFLLIVEYAEMGCLKNYLRKHRRYNSCCRSNDMGHTKPENVELLGNYYRYPCERSRHEPRHSYFHKEQLSFAWQIAKGMAYLSDLKLVHRDLATRNILLAKQKVVKISDFGLSRDVYEGETYLKRSKGKVPIKWMAIESLEDQLYTSRSDVWSFGVVLWEIMMNGASPYPGITPQRLYNLLKAGYRMTKPDYCPDEVYLLMRQCWRAIPRERPSFKELVLKLDFVLQDTVVSKMKNL